jgi:hypothetical protein
MRHHDEIVGLAAYYHPGDGAHHLFAALRPGDIWEAIFSSDNFKECTLFMMNDIPSDRLSSRVTLYHGAVIGKYSRARSAMKLPLSPRLISL